MIAVIENAVALDVTTNKKGYTALNVYEMGKGGFGFRSINIKPEQLDVVTPLLGKRNNIHISIFEGTGENGKYTSYNFVGASAAK